MAKNINKDTVLFAITTFAVCWICWGIIIALNISAKSTWYSMTLYLLGGFAPAIVALLLPLLGGKDARKEYYRRFFRFKFPVSQYLLSILIAPVMYGISYLMVFLINRGAIFTLQLQPVYMIMPLFISMIFGGGIEEFGWRGVMAGNLMKHNPIWVAFGIGCVWALWHLPLFFLQGVSQYQANFPAFVLSVLGFSFVLTAIYRKTKSVISCIIFHAIANAMGGLGFIYSNDQTLAVWIDSIAKLAVGVATLIIMERKIRKISRAQV